MPHDGASSAAVHALDSRGVFDGTLCGQDQDHFCPQEPLTRAHMAVWLVRLIDGTDPPVVKATRFSDVDGDHPQAAFIERFAALGITAGCSTVPLSYCPDGHVTRAQTATLLAHAYDLESADPAGFTDVAVGGIHSADIDALFSAGITAGCATEPLRFCPQRATPRAQMALLLVRADDYAAERQAALESLNSESLIDDGNPPGGGDTPRGNDNPPGGDDNPPPPTLIVIPPKEDEFLLQTAAGTPKVVRAITDESVNTNFQVYYPLAGTIVDPDGQTLTWSVIKPPEADWLAFDSAALTLSGRVPGSFAEGDSITITVKAIDTDAKAAEYSFSITSLGPYNPEPLGCRATSAPVALKDWIKVGNFAWAEPNHEPKVDPDAPGYWQPDYLDDDGIVRWDAPYLTKTNRRINKEEVWRIREVSHYRITRSPAWDFGSIIVDTRGQGTHDTSKVSVALPVEQTDQTRDEANDLPRLDGKWRYSLTDNDKTPEAKGYVYTVEASTCAEGPWSRGLEQQWRLPFAPKIHEHRTRLTNLDEDGHLLSDGRLALKIGWAFERGHEYKIDIQVSDPDSPGNFLQGIQRRLPHVEMDLSGGQWQVLIERASIVDVDAFHNLDGSGRQVRVRMQVRLTAPKRVEGPWTDWLYLTASEE